MQKRLVMGLKMFVISMAAVSLFVPALARALAGDGRTFVDCSGRYTIAVRTWGKATMNVYGCSNGYVFTNIKSTTNYAKGAGIVRYNPYAQRYVDTTGSSRYAAQTNMLRYVSNSCYKATGWSMDSNYGKTVAVTWCR